MEKVSAFAFATRDMHDAGILLSTDRRLGRARVHLVLLIAVRGQWGCRETVTARLRSW